MARNSENHASVPAPPPVLPMIRALYGLYVHTADYSARTQNDPLRMVATAEAERTRRYLRELESRGVQ